MAELTDDERVRILTERLGLPEGSLLRELALEALRHGSFAYERAATPSRENLRSNERLEFLGDAVLGFVVAQRCYLDHPAAPEGDLTRLRASLVREETLALAAKDIGLGELLFLGRGERRAGGRDNPAMLADALEAIIACVFLSSGIAVAQQVVERLIAPLLGRATELGRDAKTDLQHLFQSRKRTPRYHVLNIEGPAHARLYEVEVRLDGAALGRGIGRSKKEAEQAAAAAALEQPALLDRVLIDEDVAVAPWDPGYRVQFVEEAGRIRSSLGEQVVAVEHVGSTAVEDLEGKPIIDLLVGVRALDPVLRLLDYESCGEAGIPGRLYFRKRGPRPFNAHVVLHGGELWQDNVLLRDFLRANPQEAQRYAQRKREAVAAGATTLLRYSEEKGPLVDELVERARLWATSGTV